MVTDSRHGLNIMLNESCSHPVTTNETETILCWMGFLGLSSSVVCATSAVLVFVFKLHLYFVHRLALYQVLAAFFYGLALTFELVFLVPDVRNDDGKKRWLWATVSFLFLYFSWVKLLFTAWLVVHLFSQVVFYKDPQKDHKSYEVLCVIISIMAPLLFTWIPFLCAGAWCETSWKSDNCTDNKSIPGVIILWHGPAMICSIVESIAIFVIVLRLLFCYRPVQDESAASLQPKRYNALKELLPLLVYPILFGVLLIPPLINSGIIGTADTNQLNIKAAILASSISAILQPFLAGLTLLIHVVVLKVHSCRRTELQISTNYTYPNAWVFATANKLTPYTCSSEYEEVD